MDREFLDYSSKREQVFKSKTFVYNLESNCFKFQTETGEIKLVPNLPMNVQMIDPEDKIYGIQFQNNTYDVVKLIPDIQADNLYQSTYFTVLHIQSESELD